MHDRVDKCHVLWHNYEQDSNPLGSRERVCFFHNSLRLGDGAELSDYLSVEKQPDQAPSATKAVTERSRQGEALRETRPSWQGPRWLQAWSSGSLLKFAPEPTGETRYWLLEA